MGFYIIMLFSAKKSYFHLNAWNRLSQGFQHQKWMTLTFLVVVFKRQFLKLGIDQNKCGGEQDCVICLHSAPLETGHGMELQQIIKSISNVVDRGELRACQSSKPAGVNSGGSCSPAHLITAEVPQKAPLGREQK